MRNIRILALVAALSMTAVPLSANPILNEPCTNGQGEDVITVAKPFSGVVEQSPLVFGLETVDAGRYLIDLRGVEQGKKLNINFVISWTGPAPVLSDYDLYVNGASNYDVGDTESQTHTATHCQKFTVGIDTFTGVPLDTVTLDIGI